MRVELGIEISMNYRIIARVALLGVIYIKSICTRAEGLSRHHEPTSLS